MAIAYILVALIPSLLAIPFIIALVKIRKEVKTEKTKEEQKATLTQGLIENSK